ncbi:MAG TPA: aldehyde dehydrogenase family protein [Solirubrobacteraceae bacterium]|jgi:succinate-semialdehyde dehydrogenase/glutarate-semialdehyde dehydrogenase|nr:aldehyde dehydrogenase family protein [Solirubrobacteraceae bacterium]
MSTETTIAYAGSFIDGREHANGGPPLPVTNPATGEVFAAVAGGTAGDVDVAVGAARRAFAGWSALAVSNRGEILGRAAHHVEHHLEELIPVLTREQGKTLRDSRIELTKAVETLMHYAGLSKALRGAHAPNLDPGVDGIVLRRPLGVVGAIVPWNFPTTLLCNKLAPALVAGNTVVAKPAGTTPLTTLRFCELLCEGGLPAGAFNVVTGSGAGTGTALVAHPHVRKIAFTGSTPVGEQIMALAARGMKRVTLELGGSDPMIICDDADLDAAASAASMGRFYNCGQACLAIKRVYVFDAVADQVIEAITAKAKRLKVGPGDAEGSQMGPLHTAAQRDEVAGQVERTLAAGGSLAAGGGPPDAGELEGGFFYLPTVVVDPPHDTPMATEEVFGPALPIWRVTDLDEAIERANASQFGLGSSVWTRDLQRARHAAERIEAGYTWVNSRTKVYDELPFGGWKSSGYGKEHGTEAFDYYTESKSVVFGNQA